MNSVFLTLNPPAGGTLVASTYKKGPLTLLKLVQPAGEPHYEVTVVLWLEQPVCNLMVIETLPKTGKAGIDTVSLHTASGEAVPFHLSADGCALVVTRWLEAGEYVLRYRIESGLALTELVTHPHLSYDPWTVSPSGQTWLYDEPRAGSIPPRSGERA